MPVTVADLSEVKKKLTIEIPENDVVREIDKSYDQLKRTAKIRGFRPGKAPRATLERIYGKEVQADVAAKLVQETFPAAVQETGLAIIGDPDITPPDLSGEAPFTYDVLVEIRPSLPEIDFKGLELTQTAYTVAEEDVDAQLQRLQRNLTQLTALDEERPVASGDYVVIDYEAFADGKPFAEIGAEENRPVRVGENHIAGEVDEGLIGMSPGDTKEIPTTFDKDFQNPKIAGKEVVFTVTVKEIKQEVVPDLDDEFAKDTGPFETLEDLKIRIRESLAEGYAKRTEQEMNEQIFRALIEKTPFEVPEALVEYELDGIIQEAESAMQYHNMTMEQLGHTRDSLRQKYRDTAVRQVKRFLILDRIIEQEGLDLTDAELAAGYDEMAAGSGRTVEEIQKFHENNKESTAYFRQSLLEKKAIRLIVGSSDVTEKAPGEDAGEGGASE